MLGSVRTFVDVRKDGQGIASGSALGVYNALALGACRQVVVDDTCDRSNNWHQNVGIDRSSYCIPYGGGNIRTDCTHTAACTDRPSVDHGRGSPSGTGHSNGNLAGRSSIDRRMDKTSTRPLVSLDRNL